MRADPFRLDTPSRSLPYRAALAAARPFLTWALELDALAALYRQLGNRGDRFAERALELLDIAVDCPSADLEGIPRQGPLFAVANHPRGAVDGLLLQAVLGRVRGDVRLLANHLLARIPELRDSCFFVDPFGGPAAASRSRAGLRAAHRWLRRGGALVAFPAGEVAHQHGANGAPVDSPWRDTAGRLALQTGAMVLPVFIDGSNSRLFYAAGRVHPLLRTLLLGRELLRQRGRRLTVRFGQAIPPGELERLSGGDAASATAVMREAVERVTNAGRMGASSSVAHPRAGATPAAVDDTRAIEREVAALQDACLLDAGDFQVFCTVAARIPTTLREIGRLRAVAYGAVGEGTGEEVDLDEYDGRYLHLCSWDRRQRRIVGAYRIGCTDRIVDETGVEGLYTRTLFRYDRSFIERISPALELGRAFVRAEYQRNYNALLLLWKGIGRFVAARPQYRVLFGPVSISARYSDPSHAMLIAFLAQNHLDRSVAELLSATNPVKMRPSLKELPAVVPRTAEEAHRLVCSLEPDGKGMPVLLRQYLKLNARLIGFNVDPEFRGALDALMMVDLTTVDPAILARYLGPADAAAFLARHGFTRLSSRICVRGAGREESRGARGLRSGDCTDDTDSLVRLPA